MLKPVRICVALLLVIGVVMLAWLSGVHRLFVAPSAPLHEAAYAGDLESLRGILDRDPAELDQLATFKIDGRLSTIMPLMWAVRGDQPESVEELLNRGADVNAVDGLGRTALHLAASAGHPGIVQQLLDAGADINKVTPAHSSALVIAVQMKHDEAVELLLRANADIEAGGKSALVVAADYGSARSMELLLETYTALDQEDLQQLLRRAENRTTADAAAVAAVIRDHLDWIPLRRPALQTQWLPSSGITSTELGWEEDTRWGSRRHHLPPVPGERDDLHSGSARLLFGNSEVCFRSSIDNLSLQTREATHSGLSGS